MEHDFTSTPPRQTASTQHTEDANILRAAPAEHRADPNIEAAVQRHPWLVHMAQDDRIALVYGTDSANISAWMRHLPLISFDELRAAFADPALKGLYVPPWTPARAEQELAKRARVGGVGGPLPPAGADPAVWCRDEIEVRNLITSWAAHHMQDWLRGTVLAEDEVLVDFNHKYTVIQNFGGKCVVVWWEGDQLEVQEFDHWAKGRNNQTVKVMVPVPPKKEGDPWTEKEKLVPRGKYWLDHPHRAQKDRAEFAPGQKLPDNVLNLWQGWPYNPLPRDADEWGLAEKFINFCYEVLCDWDDEAFGYLLNWMARAVQKPHLPGETVVVLRSKQEGTGKSFFGEQFGKLFGRHFMQVTDAKHVVGNFNGHMATLSLLLANEAMFAGNHAEADKMKGLVTEPTIPVERKHHNVTRVPNCLHVIMTSNHDQVVNADEFARRYFVLDVTDAWMGQRAKFAAVVADLEAGGYSDLLGCLFARDITGWNPQPVPNTEALQGQKEITGDIPYLSKLGEFFVNDAVSRGWIPVPADDADMKQVIAKLNIKVHTTGLLDWLGLKGTQAELKDVGKAMRALGFQGPKAIRIGDRHGKGYRTSEHALGGYLITRGLDGTLQIDVRLDTLVL